MNKSSRYRFLQESLRLLVEHFGVEDVRAALDQVSQRRVNHEHLASDSSRLTMRPPTSGTGAMLHRLKEKDPFRHELLSEFWEQLKTRSVLSESEDIRQYSHAIGLKDLPGKSRRDLIHPLMQFLATLEPDRLKQVILDADSFSETARRDGYSVLTDKLMQTP